MAAACWQPPHFSRMMALRVAAMLLVFWCAAQALLLFLTTWQQKLPGDEAESDCKGGNCSPEDVLLSLTPPLLLQVESGCKGQPCSPDNVARSPPRGSLEIAGERHQESSICSHGSEPCDASNLHPEIKLAGRDSFGKAEGQQEQQLDGEALPPGTYSSSCKACSVSNGLLWCRCPVPFGAVMKESSIELSECSAFGNSMGTLKCDPKETPPEAAPKTQETRAKAAPRSQEAAQPRQARGGVGPKLPEEKYKESCEGCTVANGELKCRCRTFTGTQVESAVTLSSACINYDNEFGKLVCHEALPPGSYQSSCEGCTAFRGRLDCRRCQRPSPQKAKHSIVNINTCTSFSNKNGKLECDDLANAADIPEGSYQQGRCRGCSLSEARLTCTHCEDKEGSDKESSVEVQSCAGKDIANDNGKLTCVNPQSSRDEL